MSAKGAGSKRKIWMWRWTLWLAFTGLVGYRAVTMEPHGVWGYLLYLPETALIALMVLSTGSGFPRRRGWLFFVLLFQPVLWVGLTPVSLKPRQTESPDIRLVSANLDSWNTDMDQAAKELAEKSPDLLCLQEVWSEKHLAALRRAFPDFEFVPGGGEADGPFDTAVFVGVRRKSLVRPQKGSPGIAGAVVRLGRREMLVMSVHGLKEKDYWPESLMQTMEGQADQACEVLRAWQEVGSPCLVGGDFNAPITGPGLKLLRTQFQVVSRASHGGPVLTYPASLPLLEIDHVLATPSLAVREYRVFSVASDHLAVMADF